MSRTQTYDRKVHKVNGEPVLGIHAECGGTVKVTEFNRRDWLRYEAYCDRCQECDPNGYGTMAEVRDGATEYFHTAPDAGKDGAK